MSSKPEKTDNLSTGGRDSAQILGWVIKGAGIFIVAVFVLFLLIWGIDRYRTSRSAESVNRVITSLEQRVRKNPRDLDLRVVLGEAYMKEGNIDGAQEQFKQVLEVDPNHEQAMLDLGLSYQKEGEVRKAEKQFKSVIAFNELNKFRGMNKRLEAAFYYLSASEFNRGDLVDAHRNISEALAISGTNSDSRLLFGRILLNEKKYAAAEKEFSIALKFDPKFADAYFGKALALEGMKRFKEALAAAEQALVLHPDFPEARAAASRLRAK